MYTDGQRSHFYQVEIQNGTFLDHETENIPTGSEQIELQGQDIGSQRVKIEELQAKVKTVPLE